MKVKIPRAIFKKFLQSNLKILIGDANFFIPTSRNEKNFPFTVYKDKFIEPFIEHCNVIYVHSTVLSEILDSTISEFVKSHEKIFIVDESDLDSMGQTSFQTIEDAVANYTDYNPSNGCFDDAGEVKSISYAATKNLDFFVTHDGNAIKILENEHLQKFTREVQAITLYEIIYFLTKKSGDKDFLKKMYRFLYHSTKNEKTYNPSWGDFISCCDEEYSSDIE